MVVVFIWFQCIQLEKIYYIDNFCFFFYIKTEKIETKQKENNC